MVDRNFYLKEFLKCIPVKYMFSRTIRNSFDSFVFDFDKIKDFDTRNKVKAYTYAKVFNYFENTGIWLPDYITVNGLFC